MESDAEWAKAVRKAFGDRVRQIRHAQEISQEELAFRCGLDRSYVGKVERGEQNLSLENIYRIADALGVVPGDLMVEINNSLDLRQQESAK